MLVQNLEGDRYNVALTKKEFILDQESQYSCEVGLLSDGKCFVAFDQEEILCDDAKKEFD